MSSKNELGLYLYSRTLKEKEDTPIDEYRHGLFVDDPENEDIQEDYLFIKEDCYLFRELNDIKVYKSHSEHQANAESIFHVKVKVNDDNNNSKKFQISNPLFNKYLLYPYIRDINIIKNKLYYVINREHDDDRNGRKNYNEDIKENDDYSLNKNDIIKIEPMIYIVRELNDENKDKVNDIEFMNKNKNENQIFDTCTNPKTLDISNFCEHIVNDLKNIGSSTYEEKKKWIKDRLIHYQSDKVSNYKIKLLKCEKCKEKNIYPLEFKLPDDEKIHKLIEIEKPRNKNYMRLESLEQIGKDKNEEGNELLIKNIHIVELIEEGEKIYIGRRDDTDIKIDNNKVSKYHAVLIYHNGKVFIKNLSEKMETLVLIKTISQDLEIKDKKEIFLQAGRTLFEAKIMTEKEYEEIKAQNE